jgi:hypothetical protein
MISRAKITEKNSICREKNEEKRGEANHGGNKNHHNM